MEWSFSLLPLDLFPQGALSSSVITTTWVGIFVVCIFNLRFGWVLSGLIIPGYLIPLLLVKPWSAAITLLEGIITYLIVWFYSEKLSHLGYWSSLFGRDRFFALVLTSVLVRITLDIYVLPPLGLFLNDYYAWNFDYSNNLHSFGLIIVSLIANQFWKTGVIRGLLPLSVILLVSYLLVRYGLMAYTNFTLSNLSYIYEDIASSILATPKAYIILLSAAFIASRMNLRYGWDFNGILIPALLALQWYQPIKIFSSFLEAFIILWVAQLLLKLPIFANVNIEGARKLLLFFNVGFFYKILLGHFLLWQYPEFKVSDAYGFGYLLSTLMAIKMHDKGIALRFTWSTLYTSLIAVGLASLIGFFLSISDRIYNSFFGVKDFIAQNVNAYQIGNKSLIEQLRQDKIDFYQARSITHINLPSVKELEIITLGFKEIKHYLRTRDKQRLQQGVLHLSKAGFSILLLEQRYLYISDTEPTRGWGIYIIDLNTIQSLLIEIPFPIEEKGTLEAGVTLMQRMHALALASASVSKNVNRNGSANVLTNRHTAFYTFHKIMFQQDTLQVRAKKQPQKDNILHIKKSIPASLDLPLLKKLTKSYQLEWGNLHENNYIYQDSKEGIAILELQQKILRRFISSQFYSTKSLDFQIQYKRIDGYLQEWLFSKEDIIAKSGSNKYQIPKQEELLFFDEEIITPLLTLIKEYKQDNLWSSSLKEKLNIISGYADIFDYTLVLYQHQQSGQQYILLQEQTDNKKKHYWGTYIFRLGEAAPYMLEIPRPLYEVNSFEYGVSLFEQLNAAYLCIAGAHPHANIDGSADLVKLQNRQSIFTLVNQVIMREYAENSLNIFSIRAFGYREDMPFPKQDMIISLRYAHSIYQPDGAKELLQLLQQNQINYQLVQGDPETAGYEVGSLPQSLYARVSPNKLFGILWLSPYLRQAYYQKDSNKQEDKQFKAVGIDTKEVDLTLYLWKQYITTKNFNKKVVDKKILETTIKIIQHYIHNPNILLLLQLKNKHYTYQRIIDRDSRQSFLFISDKKGNAVLLVNLSPRNINTQTMITNKKDSQEKISKFIYSRYAWLHFYLSPYIDLKNYNEKVR